MHFDDIVATYVPGEVCGIYANVVLQVRKYRERLEDEMERHRKEVQESRTKLRKLEADTRQMEDLKNKITEFESKTSKLTKEAGKSKEQEIELTETKTKNRELQRQVSSMFLLNFQLFMSELLVNMKSG
jgi:septal ring factor EnvC (AmiA/AmiB activator)